jgi:predicted 2-oxoglutarate/Fe(II)-dependent dioxygenase YbiX
VSTRKAGPFTRSMKPRSGVSIVSFSQTMRSISSLSRLWRACLPEITRAFQTHPAYFHRILIARYDDAGCFLRHRDNSAPAVAYRQFAMSINLNTGEYDGGHLLFPEYNDYRYKPGLGAGIVFSATLLHEATPVLKGARYVLLTFVHNAEAETRRLMAGPDVAPASIKAPVFQ